MELFVGVQSITFQELEARLLALVNAKIRNGEYSERRLAVLLGISQPHLHHVLKGDRKLQTALADLLLKKFGISVTDLFRVSDGSLPARYAQGAPPDPELARLRELRKRPATYRKRDRSEWAVG